MVPIKAVHCNRIPQEGGHDVSISICASIFFHVLRMKSIVISLYLIFNDTVASLVTIHQLVTSTTPYILLLNKYIVITRHAISSLCIIQGITPSTWNYIFEICHNKSQTL